MLAEGVRVVKQAPPRLGDMAKVRLMYCEGGSLPRGKISLGNGGSGKISHDNGIEGGPSARCAGRPNQPGPFMAGVMSC